MNFNQCIRIDTNALIKNVNYIKNIVGSEVLLAPVIKGNAYGHGLTHIAQILDKLKEVEFLSLTSIYDAIHLQNKGIKKKYYS